MNSLALRKFHDAIALPLHLITICVACGVPSFRSRFVLGARSATAALLLSQEAIAATAHAFYLTLYRSNQLISTTNAWKWGEYAASATVGTLATALIETTDHGWAWLTFLAIAGVSQQFVGYSIDKSSINKSDASWIWVNFFLGCILQVTIIPGPPSQNPGSDCPPPPPSR